jgi:hypothetical protein
MTPTIKVTSPADMLSIVPSVLGYMPANALVVVCVRDARIAFSAVSNLTTLDSPRQIASAIRAVAAQASKAAVSRAFVILYPAAGILTNAARTVAARFVHSLDTDHSITAAAFVVGKASYWSLGCADATCCHTDRRPITDLDSTTARAEAVYAGTAPAASREDALRIPRAAGTDLRSAAVLYDVERHAMSRRHYPAVRYDIADQHMRKLLTVTGAGLPTASLCGVVAATMTNKDGRDACLLRIVNHVTRTKRPLTTEGIEASLKALVDTASAESLDFDRMNTVIEALRAVIAAAPEPSDTVGPLTLLALVYWWSGQPSAGSRYVTEALAIDPAYTLARLVDGLFRYSIPPAWLATND